MFAPNSIILYVSDVNNSSNFYSKVLKKSPIEEFEDFTVFALADNFILGLQQKDAIDPKAPKTFGGVELSFSDVTKEEVDKIYAEWFELGVTIELSPQELDFGYTFVGNDPDGHRLRVCATDTTNIK